MMQISVKILRYDPESEQKPYYQTYLVDVDPTDSVLSVLELIKGQQDGTLSFRRSCGHGVCGSDGMRINGMNGLACKTLVQNVGSKIILEPLLGLVVKKDLMVDMEPFYENFREVKPWLISNDPAPEKERLQTPAERARFDDTTKCIQCACCTTACPSFWASDDYVGPAAIVAAHRFIFDSRDQGADERLQIMSEVNGVYRCHTVYNCTMACPRGIQITKAIGEVKAAIGLGKPK
jgi:succinate dehydrogenase / fumarate reductase, iron-sulfur subunit